MSGVVGLFLWSILPYITIAFFISGHVYTYLTRRYYWSARSTELLQKRYHIITSNLWHYGIVIVLLGHVVGLAIPASALSVLGMSEKVHEEIAVYLGSVFGALAIVGLVGLLIRDYTLPRVRATLRPSDHVVYILLLLVVGLGVYNTLVVHPDFENTVAPWLQGVLVLHPDPSLMAGVPLTLQVHIVLSMLLFIAWPFSRLVHVWSFPITYLWRPYIVYRGYAYYSYRGERK